jgi:3-isopropylmalate/(R)-2-methylmalate dehydratase small subunit
MFNCGMPAIELPEKDIDALFKLPDQSNTICDIDMAGKTLIFSWGKGKSTAIDFSLSEFDEALVKAGGWVEFADKKY